MPREQRELVGYPRDWTPPAWPDDCTLAVSVVVNVEEGSHRSFLLGDGATETSGEGFFADGRTDDERIASWFAYARRSGLPRLDAIFRELGVPVTAFAAALALERDPEVARIIREGDYEVCSHGHRWVPTNDLSDTEMVDHVRAAVDSLTATTGRRPRGWFSRGPNTSLRDALVAEGGFLYDSDAFADDLPWFVEVDERPWLVIPYSFTFNDMKFWRSPGVSSPAEWRSQLTAGFERLLLESRTSPKMMSVGLHLRSAGLPARADALREFLAPVMETPGVWVTTREEIARHWWEHVDEVPLLRG